MVVAPRAPAADSNRDAVGESFSGSAQLVNPVNTRERSGRQRIEVPGNRMAKRSSGWHRDSGHLHQSGKPIACGWLEDRFGVAWQVIPSRLPELLSDRDPARARRALAAMMKMQKIDVGKLERAADGR